MQTLVRDPSEYFLRSMKYAEQIPHCDDEFVKFYECFVYVCICSHVECGSGSGSFTAEVQAVYSSRSSQLSRG